MYMMKGLDLNKGVITVINNNIIRDGHHRFFILKELSHHIISSTNNSILFLYLSLRNYKPIIKIKIIYINLIIS